MAARVRFSQKKFLNGNVGGGGAGDIVAGGGYTLGRSTCRPNFLAFYRSDQCINAKCLKQKKKINDI